MINLLNTSAIIFTTALLMITPKPLSKKMKMPDLATVNGIQTSDGAILNELNALCTKQLRASGLAAKQGGTQVKDWGGRLSVVLSGFSDELKVLAKKRSVKLAGTLPEGGQRPDGRVDANSENLKDTSRLGNAGGEAGNSGTVKTKPMGINDGASNALAESLLKLRGSAFDRAYRNLLISDRPVAEKLLIKASASKDSGISAFAGKYLNKLRSAKI